MAGAYLLAMWCPVFRWRDFDWARARNLRTLQAMPRENSISAKHEGGKYRCAWRGRIIR